MERQKLERTYSSRATKSQDTCNGENDKGMPPPGHEDSSGLDKSSFPEKSSVPEGEIICS